MAWVCLTCLNCSIFSGLKLHLEAYLPQNPGCPLWKFPWTQMWQKALRDGSAAGEREAGCEKEQAYCVWHMTFKEREAEKKGKIKDKIKCHSQRHAATGKPLIAGFVLTVPYSTLSLIRPRKDLFSDEMTKPIACDLNPDISFQSAETGTQGNIMMPRQVRIGFLHLHTCTYQKTIIKTHRKNEFWLKEEGKWLWLFSPHPYQWEGPLQEAYRIPAASMKTDPWYILTGWTIPVSLWI